MTAGKLPEYQSHKRVHALKILSIGYHQDGGAFLVPVDRAYSPIRVSKEYVNKHAPVATGYWVRYKDGYESFSPADAFEQGYTRI